MAKEDFYNIDLRQWEKNRYLKVKLTKIPKDPGDFDIFLNDLHNVWIKDEEFSMFMDVSDIRSMIPKCFAKKMSTFMEHHEALSRKNLKKTGILVGSKFIKIFLDLLFTFRRPVTIMRTFEKKNIRDCYNWLGWVKKS